VKPRAPFFVRDEKVFWSEPQDGWYPSIYALFEAEDVVRYVGFSKRPLQRLACHERSTTGNPRLSDWIDSQMRIYGCLHMVILERAEWETWDLQEARWIEFYRSRLGRELLNIDAGGRSVPERKRDKKKAIMNKRRRAARRWLNDERNRIKKERRASRNRCTQGISTSLGFVGKKVLKPHRLFEQP
jgi:hypothetical protein